MPILMNASLCPIYVQVMLLGPGNLYSLLNGELKYAWKSSTSAHQ